MYFGHPTIKSLPQKFKCKKSALKVFVEISSLKNPDCMEPLEIETEGISTETNPIAQ